MSYTKSELQDYSLSFKSEAETPKLACLYQEDKFIGSVSPRIHRDGSVSYELYHAFEGYRISLDSDNTHQKAKDHLVWFHISHYEK